MSEYTFPTHEVVTPHGKNKVVLKDFISGFDDEAIESIYTRGKHKVKAVDPEAAARGEMPEQDVEIDGAAIQEAEREGVKRVVISVDGNTYDGDQEKILEAVYNLRKEDTRFVKKEVDKVVNPKDESTAKKKNG
jgi:hypothetical protein